MSSIQLVVCIAFLTLAACSAPKQGQISQAPTDAIIGGVDANAESDVLTSIVGIFDYKAGAICTGSLLPNNVVLTAAHCIGDDPSKMFIVFGTDMMKIITSTEQSVLIASVRQVTSTKTHSGWDPAVEDSDIKWHWNDIALIKFKGAAPKGFKPANFLTDPKVLIPGSLVTLAGYGVDKMKIESVDPKTITGLDEAIANGELACSPDKTDCLKMDSSGDGILRSVEVKISQALQTEIVVNQKEGRGSCSGDSGGPAYIKKDGKLYLWGITSRGDIGCDLDGVYTNALTYMDWINKESGNMK